MEAAELLAQKLLAYRGKHPLILGVPRGAVPMAALIAKRLDGDLDIVLAHKIGAPGNPEFAIGAVSEFGTVYKSSAACFYNLSSEEFDELALNALNQLHQKSLNYAASRTRVDPTQRLVIIVDDGIATGATLLAAVRGIKTRHPKKLIIAAPVASPNALQLLRPEIDESVLLHTPLEFFSIGQFYDEFTQVTDAEVKESLGLRSETKIKNL
jgi:predicted phosphoribosyltransferase